MLLEDIEREYPIKERLMHKMKAWLERDCEASWVKVVSALQRIGHHVLAMKVECTAAKPITGPCHVISPNRRPGFPVKLQPSPGLLPSSSFTDSHDVGRTKNTSKEN